MAAFAQALTTQDLADLGGNAGSASLFSGGGYLPPDIVAETNQALAGYGEPPLGPSAETPATVQVASNFSDVVAGGAVSLGSAAGNAGNAVLGAAQGAVSDVLSLVPWWLWLLLAAIAAVVLIGVAKK